MVTSRERVLAVLEGKIPDRVPWIENYVSNEVTKALLGSSDFLHANYSHKVEKPGMIRIPPDIRKAIPLDNISYDLSPPRYARTENVGGHEHIIEGLIKTSNDLKLLDNLPDPDDEALYRPAEDYLRQYKCDSVAIATVRTGISNTYLSMGIDHFCRCLILEPGFVRDIMERFSDWSVKVVKNIQKLPFDVFFIPDDIGFGNAPMISPHHFREFCLPIMKKVIEAAKIPVIYHSDGNIMPLIEDLINLGIVGIANLEPGAMDIEEVKLKYGDRITLIGNIDLHYTLTQGTPEETMEEVRKRILTLAPGGRYILASANSLPSYVKPQNVLAMGEALLKYGTYPIKI